MGTLSFKPLCLEFNCAVHTICDTIWPQGFDLSETKAPDSLKKLKAEYAERGRITVYSGASDNTIFDDPGTNHKFRAWHDWCHLHLDADFSFQGEVRAAVLQIQHVMFRYGMGDTTYEIMRYLWAEVVGQAAYWQKHRKYVKDQRAFVSAYVAAGDPMTAALTMSGREW